MLYLLTTMNLKDNPLDYYKIEVEVTAPLESGDYIYMSGSIGELGNFEAKGLKLTKLEPGRYKGSFYTKFLGKLEYKYNLGTWNQAETCEDNTEMVDNRIIELQGKQILIKDTVINWEGLQKSSITGDFQIFFDFKSKYLDEKRNIYVWLPPGYKNDKNSKYPMILCQDGQNLFDASTSFLGVEWEMDESATKLISRYEIDPIIIVGVANTDNRVYEYTPFGKTEGGGGVENYGRFIVEELMPFLIKRFNIDTRSGRTCTLGASIGALASLYLYTKYPRIFNMAAIISPATFFCKEQITPWLEEQEINPKGKIWLDIGQGEGIQNPEGISDALKITRKMKRILENKGFENGKTISYYEDPDGEHNELSWQKRVPMFLKFLYGNKYGNINL